MKRIVHGSARSVPKFVEPSPVPLRHLEGSLPGDVAAELERIPAASSAKDFSASVTEQLRRLGFEIQTEYLVKNRGDGRRGRVDLVASRGPDVIAIELDRKTPRQKSVFKVRQVRNATAHLVLCREV